MLKICSIYSQIFLQWYKYQKSKSLMGMGVGLLIGGGLGVAIGSSGAKSGPPKKNNN
jgi:hypothetical protein